MKRLLITLISLALTLGAPLGEAAAGKTSKSAHKAGSSKVVKKAAKKKATAKKSTKAKTKAKNKVKAKTGKKQVISSRHKQTVKSRHGAVAAPMLASYAPPMSIDYQDSLVNDELSLHSAAAMVVDQRTGEALYAKNPDMATPIASITKLMTAMVTLDAGLPLHEDITISSEDMDRLKYTGSRLAVGTTLSRAELLHLALIASENRAAAALSRAYPGGRPAFIAAMNRKARELGMHNTYFLDSTGLSSQNRSTAADLVKLVDASYRYPAIRRISTTGEFDITVPGTRTVKVREGRKVRTVSQQVERHLAFVNTNALTRVNDWDIGVSKTGYINEAGHCLVMQANIGQQPVIIVLLDALGKWSRIGDANRIRKWLEHGAHGHMASQRRDTPV